MWFSIDIWDMIDRLCLFEGVFWCLFGPVKNSNDINETKPCNHLKTLQRTQQNKFHAYLNCINDQTLFGLPFYHNVFHSWLVPLFSFPIFLVSLCVQLDVYHKFLILNVSACTSMLSTYLAVVDTVWYPISAAAYRTWGQYTSVQLLKVFFWELSGSVLT